MTVRTSSSITPSPPPGAGRAGGGARGTLAVLSLAQFLVALDYSIVYVALPSITAELGLGPALAPWVVSAYAVLFAGFLVLGGRIADRAGPRRAFVVAVVAFGVASALGAVAGDAALLLAARAGQGLAAALVQPAILGLLTATFPAGPARARALAVWGAVGASGLAAGVVLGGVLTTVSWRLTFAVNVPLTLLAAAGALAWVARPAPRTPPTPVPDAGPAPRVPALASALGTGAALTLVAGLTLGVDHGWRAPVTVVGLAVGLVLLVGFLAHERRATAVLVARELRRLPTLRLGALATALYMASVGSEFFLLTLLLQSRMGYGPLAAGLAFLPLAAMVTVGNVAAGRALRVWSGRAVLTAGFVLSATGLAWVALALPGAVAAGSYPALLGGILLSGLGHGVVYTSMFVVGTHDVPTSHQSSAGALLTTSQYLAGAVMLAVLTLVLGPVPDDGAFRSAVLLTAGAAAAGALVTRAPRRERSP